MYIWVSVGQYCVPSISALSQLRELKRPGTRTHSPVVEVCTAQRPSGSGSGSGVVLLILDLVCLLPTFVT